MSGNLDVMCLLLGSNQRSHSGPVDPVNQSGRQSISLTAGLWDVQEEQTGKQASKQVPVASRAGGRSRGVVIVVIVWAGWAGGQGR